MKCVLCKYFVPVGVCEWVKNEITASSFWNAFTRLDGDSSGSPKKLQTQRILQTIVRLCTALRQYLDPSTGALTPWMDQTWNVSSPVTSDVTEKTDGEDCPGSPSPTFEVVSAFAEETDEQDAAAPP